MRLFSRPSRLLDLAVAVGFFSEPPAGPVCEAFESGGGGEGEEVGVVEFLTRIRRACSNMSCVRNDSVWTSALV